MKCCGEVPLKNENIKPKTYCIFFSAGHNRHYKLLFKLIIYSSASVKKYRITKQNKPGSLSSHLHFPSLLFSSYTYNPINIYL